MRISRACVHRANQYAISSNLYSSKPSTVVSAEMRLLAGMRVFQRGANYIRKLDSLHRLALDMLCIINLSSNRDIHLFDQNMLINNYLSMASCNGQMCSKLNYTFRLLSSTSTFSFASLCACFFGFLFFACVFVHLLICVCMYVYM